MHTDTNSHTHEPMKLSTPFELRTQDNAFKSQHTGVKRKHFRADFKLTLMIVAARQAGCDHAVGRRTTEQPSPSTGAPAPFESPPWPATLLLLTGLIPSLRIPQLRCLSQTSLCVSMQATCRLVQFIVLLFHITYGWPLE